MIVVQVTVCVILLITQFYTFNLITVMKSQEIDVAKEMRALEAKNAMYANRQKNGWKQKLINGKQVIANHQSQASPSESY